MASKFTFPEKNKIPDVNTEDLINFTSKIENNAPVVREPSPDPKAKPTFGINVRLNEYQLNLIRSIAEKEERSQQYIVKNFLMEKIKEYMENQKV